MEGIVAKRCLRQNSLGKQYNYVRKDTSRKDTYSSVYKKNMYVSKKLNKEESVHKGFIEKIVFNFKMKLWIQTVTAISLAILIIMCDMLNLNFINNSKYIKKLRSEYNKNYSITDIKNNTVKGVKYVYGGIIKIVPIKVKNKIKNVYQDFKENFNKEENKNIEVYQEKSKEEEQAAAQTISNDGKGVSIVEVEEIVKEETVVEAVSAISSEDSYLQYIKDNNIKFVMPTKGTVSSSFGAREVIFTDIDSFHTGVDIANAKGTNIMASTDGTVTKVANNKYNGNFVEITNGKVVTKYAHMDSVSIKSGVKVKAGDIIGKMGETGYATGPHLHFEVVIDGVKIDPAKVLNL